MPFQRLPENDPGKADAQDFGLLFIRVFAVVFFFYYQLASQLKMAFAFVWEKADWPLVAEVAEIRFPFPPVVALAITGILTIASAGLAFGIFSRVNAFVLTVLVGFAFVGHLKFSRMLNVQSAVLYLVVFLGLLWAGGGRISLDHLLSGRRSRR